MFFIFKSFISAFFFIHCKRFFFNSLVKQHLWFYLSNGKNVTMFTVIFSEFLLNIHVFKTFSSLISLLGSTCEFFVGLSQWSSSLRKSTETLHSCQTLRWATGCMTRVGWLHCLSGQRCLWSLNPEKKAVLGCALPQASPSS